MKEISIVPISPDNRQDLDFANQPFLVFGRLVPSFFQGRWTYAEELLPQPYECCFPAEEVEESLYIARQGRQIFFAYQDGACIGQIRIRQNWNNFCFVEDLAVARDHRRKGIARLLLDDAARWAMDRGLIGFMLEAQDFNLGALRAYMKMGFVLGGADAMLYAATPQKHDLALFLYKVFVKEA